MFERAIKIKLENVVKDYPVVTITGPRQSGKTTLVKETYPNKSYYNLESPDLLELILSDPREFFNNIDLKRGVILDEIQRAPELLSYIQVIVDENRIPGAFILTGSHQILLLEAVSQSLAGRCALLELLPLSINELKHAGFNLKTNEYLLNGLFPAIYKHNLDPVDTSRNYMKTYVERDVRQIINIKDLHSFQKFVKLCAGRVGSTVNLESLSSDVGVSQNTIKNWLSLMEASYILFQLQPYFENLGKRLMKAPKIYFLDVGLASYLLGIKSIEQVSHDRLKGALFENLVITEILKYKYNRGEDSGIYFFRDSNHNEVDIIITAHDKLIPVEIKSTSTFNSSLLKGIKYFKRSAKDRYSVGFLIYAGEMEYKIDNIYIINYKRLHKMMRIIKELINI